MAESVRDNRLLWGLVVVGLLVLLSLFWIWNVGNTLSGIDQRGQQLEARFADVGAADAVAALEARQAELEAKISALQMPDLAPVQQQVDELKTGLKGLEERFAGFTIPGLEDLTARLAAVETAVGGIAPADLTAVTADIDGLRTSLDGLRTQIGDLAPARVDELAGRIDTVSQQVAAIEIPDVAALTTRVDALDTRLGTVEAAIADTAPAEPDALAARLDAFAAQLAAIAPLETRIGAVATDVETLKTGVAAAATSIEVTALDTRLSDLGTQVDVSGAGLATVQAQATDLATQVTDLGADLATRAAGADVTALSDQLTALGQQVAALPATDTAAVEADVSALRAALDTLATQVAALPAADELVTLRTDLDRIATNPPAAPPPQVIERIYFGQSGTSVAEAELPKIAALAERLGSNPSALSLVGFSDSSGPAELNRSLSLRRAAAVRLALLAAGVDPAALTSVTGLGEDAPPIDAGDDAEEAGNRVVLIYGRP